MIQLVYMLTKDKNTKITAYGELTTMVGHYKIVVKGINFAHELKTKLAISRAELNAELDNVQSHYEASNVVYDKMPFGR